MNSPSSAVFQFLSFVSQTGGTPLSIISDPSDDTGENPDKALGLWSLDAIEPLESLSLVSPQVLLTSWIRQVLSPSWKL